MESLKSERLENLLSHTHDLATPSKRRYLKSNREISKHSRELFVALNASNVPPTEKFSIVAWDFGGYDQMTFTQRKFSNMRRDDRLAISRDVDLIIDKFEERKRALPSFFYDILSVDDY